MFLKKNSDGSIVYPYTVADFYAEHPNTSFPADVTVLFPEYGVYPVEPRPYPTSYDPQTQNIAELPPVMEDGAWVQQWTITEATDEEKAERLAARRARMASISDRQFFQQAAVVGIISKSEALAAVQTGTIPTVLQAIIDAEPDANNRFEMEMLLSGATVFQRNHPMTAGIGAALGLSEQEIDTFFIDAAKL